MDVVMCDNSEQFYWNSVVWNQIQIILLMITKWWPQECMMLQKKVIEKIVTIRIIVVFSKFLDQIIIKGQYTVREK